MQKPTQPNGNPYSELGNCTGVRADSLPQILVNDRRDLTGASAPYDGMMTIQGTTVAQGDQAEVFFMHQNDLLPWTIGATVGVQQAENTPPAIAVANNDWLFTGFNLSNTYTNPAGKKLTGAIDSGWNFSTSADVQRAHCLAATVRSPNGSVTPNLFYRFGQPDTSHITCTTSTIAATGLTDLGTLTITLPISFSPGLFFAFIYRNSLMGPSLKALFGQADALIINTVGVTEEQTIGFFASGVGARTQADAVFTTATGSLCGIYGDILMHTGHGGGFAITGTNLATGIDVWTKDPDFSNFPVTILAAHTQSFHANERNSIGAFPTQIGPNAVVEKTTHTFDEISSFPDDDQIETTTDQLLVMDIRTGSEVPFANISGTVHRTQDSAELDSAGSLVNFNVLGLRCLTDDTATGSFQIQFFTTSNQDRVSKEIFSPVQVFNSGVTVSTSKVSEVSLSPSITNTSAGFSQTDTWSGVATASSPITFLTRVGTGNPQDWPGNPGFNNCSDGSTCLYQGIISGMPIDFGTIRFFNGVFLDTFTPGVSVAGLIQRDATTAVLQAIPYTATYIGGDSSLNDAPAVMALANKTQYVIIGKNRGAGQQLVSILNKSDLSLANQLRLPAGFQVNLNQAMLLGSGLYLCGSTATPGQTQIIKVV